MSDSFSTAGSAFAVVSPCSQCKNQLSEQSSDGKPFCPRRKWQKDAAQAKDNNDTDSRTEILTAFGTEGTPQEGDNSLHNPVYLDNGKTTLVWIATLRDNSGVRDSDNNVIAPQILDPSFIPDNTDWIHCRPLPYVPFLHEAGYRQSGALKEGDHLIAVTVQNQQQTTETVADGSNLNEYRQVLIEGVVSKVNLAHFTPRKAVEVDYTVQGT